MGVITRDQVRPVSLPSEEVSVTPLGGAVIVRGMDLPAMLAFNAERRRVGEPLPGETAEQADERARAQCVTVALHHCVLAADLAPIYSPKEWGVFGARNPAEAMDLFNRVVRLSGLDADAEKKA